MRKRIRKIHIGTDVYGYIIGCNVTIWKNGTKIKVLRAWQKEEHLVDAARDSRNREWDERNETYAIWPSDVKAYIIKNKL